jgi:guanine deaminase
MQDRAAALVINGTLIHSPSRGDVEVIEDAVVVVDADGNIDAVAHASADEGRRLLAGAEAAGTLQSLAAGQYLLPGLVDLHIHAPQWPQLGKALHIPLDEWLQDCTYPLEAKYDDLAFAERAYTSLIDTLLAHGTTTATYFGTVHLEATKRLAELALEKGQRAVVGKVAMDNPDQCPDYYRDASTADGLADTRALIEHVRGMPGNAAGRVIAAVTPRFIPSCSDDMLTGLGAIAAEYNCHIQTHCSESDWAHQYVIERHGLRDTQSLDRFGLLTDKTILAHANLIDDADMDTIHGRKSGIAHCPLSNVYFSHAVFPLRRVLDRGVKVGLGTDISGGPSPSILHNCQHAVTMSRVLEDGVDATVAANDRGVPGARIDFREAFWMATAGGADALGINAGRIAPGHAFDAIVIDTTIADSDVVAWEGLDTIDDVLQKLIYNADRRNVATVWVQGQRVRG